MCGQCRGIACANSLQTLNNSIDDAMSHDSLDSDAEDIVAAVDTASGTDEDEHKAEDADDNDTVIVSYVMELLIND